MPSLFSRYNKSTTASSVHPQASASSSAHVDPTVDAASKANEYYHRKKVAELVNDSVWTLQLRYQGSSFQDQVNSMCTSAKTQAEGSVVTAKSEFETAFKSMKGIAKETRMNIQMVKMSNLDAEKERAMTETRQLVREAGESLIERIEDATSQNPSGKTESEGGTTTGGAAQASSLFTAEALESVMKDLNVQCR